SGMYFVEQVAGEGPTVHEGDTCFLRYAGYFLDGSIFDSSDNYYEDGIWEFVYKEVNLIPGFDEGIGMLNKGAEMDFIIPSELAYGATGVSGIPPYTPLLFATILDDLKPKTE
ncbi:FKBP-type peptidyl-prolyl cis-trans isomerase, partial [Draconibacterium sp.]|nr:FKBP-type peptidyl-prolyl cis-trans isomerase [Draconibacterium sp.]